MYTRMVEITAKQGKTDQLLETMRDSILRKLRSQPGFIDMIGLVSDHNRSRLVAISFWDTKENAERFQRDHFNEIVETLRPQLESDPTVRTFDVETSTVHRIAAGKAA